MPRIAVTLGPADSTPRREANERYLQALTRAGAEPVAIAPEGSPPSQFDALCLTGGGDIDPAWYGDENETSKRIIPARDSIELALAARALDSDIPILGICRGFQLLNVAFRGRLVQNVDAHEAGEFGPTMHTRVVAAPGSHLSAACGLDEFDINSRHHQAVTPELLAKGLRATLTVDGLIEAFESTRHRWVVGVQWHPERVDEVKTGHSLFGAFVRAAARRPIAAR